MIKAIPVVHRQEFFNESLIMAGRRFTSIIKSRQVINKTTCQYKCAHLRAAIRGFYNAFICQFFKTFLNSLNNFIIACHVFPSSLYSISLLSPPLIGSGPSPRSGAPPPWPSLPGASACPGQGAVSVIPGGRLLFSAAWRRGYHIRNLLDIIYSI